MTCSVTDVTRTLGHYLRLPGSLVVYMFQTRDDLPSCTTLPRVLFLLVWVRSLYSFAKDLLPTDSTRVFLHTLRPFTLLQQWSLLDEGIVLGSKLVVRGIFISGDPQQGLLLGLRKEVTGVGSWVTNSTDGRRHDLLTYLPEFICRCCLFVLKTGCFRQW